MDLVELCGASVDAGVLGSCKGLSSLEGEYESYGDLWGR